MSKQVHEIPVMGEGEGFPLAATAAKASRAASAAPAGGVAGAADVAGAPSSIPGLTMPPPLDAYQSAPPPGMPGVPAAPVAAPAAAPGGAADGLLPPPIGAPLPPMPPPSAFPLGGAPVAQAAAAPAAAAQAAAAPVNALPPLAAPAASAAMPQNVTQSTMPQASAAPFAMAPAVATPPLEARQVAAPVAQPAAQPVAQPEPQAAPPQIPVAQMPPPVVEVLPTDIDPLGRVNVGFTPHPGADADLVMALQEVVRLTASDLHLTANAPPMLRLDGALTPLEGSQVWDRERVARALFSILTDVQRKRFEDELELDFAFAVSESARFRVNLYQQRESVGAAFRLIPTEIKPLEQLGIPDTVARFAELSRGLVLITGPTGSGKSTTLAALVDLVNRTRTDHIVTVEDPIEFMHGNKRSLINQREVGADTHSFSEALKHVLRQDPDVILIGELRDLETISVALTAAETGHLVFATLHTQDAAQSIDRVIDVFPPHQQAQVRAQLAATLQGVVCQTLVKVASGKGRLVATEVMVTTPAIANLIREAKTYQIPSVLQASRELGMFTMDQHLAELVNNGKITHAAAMEKAHDFESLKALIHRADPGTDFNVHKVR